MLCVFQSGDDCQTEEVTDENKGLIWTLVKQVLISLPACQHPLKPQSSSSSESCWLAVVTQTLWLQIELLDGSLFVVPCRRVPL